LKTRQVLQRTSNLALQKVVLQPPGKVIGDCIFEFIISQIQSLQVRQTVQFRWFGKVNPVPRQIQQLQLREGTKGDQGLWIGEGENVTTDLCCILLDKRNSSELDNTEISLGIEPRRLFPSIIQ
jgi:hypothetical protein